jgi:HEAT repeat protein
MTRFVIVLGLIGVLASNIHGQEAELQRLRDQVRKLEAENKALKDQIAKLTEARKQRFHRLLQQFGEERNEVRWIQVLEEMALTSGQPELSLREGSTDFKLATQEGYLHEAVNAHLSRKDIPTLVDLAEKAPLVPARSYAMQFLMWMDAKEALPTLRRLTKDSNETVRRNATRAVEVIAKSLPD